MIELDILEDYTNMDKGNRPIRGIEYELWSPPVPSVVLWGKHLES
jgi:hypothetical protein